MAQVPVHLYDPINDFVQMELDRRRAEYSSTSNINILVATINLNGRTDGIASDLSSWLCPELPSMARATPEIVAVGFDDSGEEEAEAVDWCDDEEEVEGEEDCVDV